MSHHRMTPALHIARKHQSAPAAHWADEEIRKAAVEIDEGRYVADTHPEAILDGLGLSLGFGQGSAARGKKPALEEFQETRSLNELSRHPRVVEAIERMKKEVEETTNPQEAIENLWKLHELNSEAAKRNKWDGQSRWEGKENEEARHGKLLTPIAFHEQLCTVIGRERVLLSPHAVKERETDKSARVGLYIKNPLWVEGSAIVTRYKQDEAADLRKLGEAEFLKARKLRLAGHNAEADKGFNLAGDFAKAATEILMELSTEAQIGEKELLRCGSLQWPLGTEWMIMHFDKYGVPTKAKFLGWRTALLTMVRTSVITEREANKAFPVGSGHAADWYREQMQQMRNEGKTIN